MSAHSSGEMTPGGSGSALFSATLFCWTSFSKHKSLLSHRAIHFRFLLFFCVADFRIRFSLPPP
jgi:hypothetical protein